MVGITGSSASAPARAHGKWHSAGGGGQGRWRRSCASLQTHAGLAACLFATSDETWSSTGTAPPARSLRQPRHMCCAFAAGARAAGGRRRVGQPVRAGGPACAWSGTLQQSCCHRCMDVRTCVCAMRGRMHHDEAAQDRGMGAPSGRRRFRRHSALPEPARWRPLPSERRAVCCGQLQERGETMIEGVACRSAADAHPQAVPCLCACLAPPPPPARTGRPARCRGGE